MCRWSRACKQERVRDSFWAQACVTKTQVKFKGEMLRGKIVGYAYARVGACVRECHRGKKGGEGVKNSLWLLSEYSPHAPLSAGLVYVGHAAGCASGTRLGRAAARSEAHQNKAASAPLPHRVEGKSMSPDEYRSSPRHQRRAKSKPLSQPSLKKYNNKINK